MEKGEPQLIPKAEVTKLMGIPILIPEPGQTFGIGGKIYVYDPKKDKKPQAHEEDREVWKNILKNPRVEMDVYRRTQMRIVKTARKEVIVA